MAPVIDFERLVDGLSDVYFVTRADGQILYTNRSVRQELGYAPLELVGKDWLSLVANVDPVALLGFETLSTPAPARNMMVALEHSEGEVCCFGISCSTLPDTTDVVLACRPSGAVQQQLAEASRWAAALLEKTDELE